MGEQRRIDGPEVIGAAESHVGSAVFAAQGVRMADTDGREPQDDEPPGTSGSVDPDATRVALLHAKLEAMAEFAAGAGHEINNPVAAISGRVQLLLRDETDPERRRHLRTIGAQTLRIRDMIGDAMLFARPPEPEPETVDLTAATEDVLAHFHESMAERDLTVSGRRETETPVNADPTQLRIVISELIRNAIYFSPEGEPITIECLRTSDEESQLIVADRGPGLSPTDREHLFDPFYSGRQAGRGLGFGLSKCWRIVTLHGGSIRATEDGRFAIIVDWPTPSS